MCRMLGILGIKPINPVKYLLDVECSLLKQAELGDQGDGWGVGYYVEGVPRIVKSEKPVYSESEKFREVAAAISSNIIVAHVRKASNPRNLPREILIDVRNSQPFGHGAVIFAHNGVIRIPDEAMDYLNNYRDLVRGVNDSEVYFALLMEGWSLTGDPAEALRWVEEVLWKALKSSGRGLGAPYTSLNAIFSEGKKLYAYNRCVEGRDLRSICYKDSPYYALTYLNLGDRLLVASERLWRGGGWNRLDDGELLTAWSDGSKIKYDIKRIL